MAPAWKPRQKSYWNEKSQWTERSWNERSQWSQKWNDDDDLSRWRSVEFPDISTSTDRKVKDAGGLSEQDLIVAVQACYHQEIYPQDVLLLWMLKGYKKVGLEEIQSVADASYALQLEHSTTSKKGFAVLLQRPPVGFSGFADDADYVPPALVEEAAMMVLSGGWLSPDQSNHDRISIAAWLHGNEKLQQLTLGKCLALVNMLLASHSVLGKRAGRLVPYFQSEEYEKQENARRKCPTALREDEVWVSSWEELIGYLKLLLEENGGKMMSARVKNEMRARFNLEFSETALGHVSLGSLLDDPRLLEHFDVRKSPPAADLILLKDKSWWKEKKTVPKSPGNLSLNEMKEDGRKEKCVQQLISTGPWRQELLLPLPCQPWEIVSEICNKEGELCTFEEV